MKLKSTYWYDGKKWSGEEREKHIKMNVHGKPLNMEVTNNAMKLCKLWGVGIWF